MPAGWPSINVNTVAPVVVKPETVSMAIEWIIIVFMFLSGINFALLYFALLRNFRAVFESEELRSYTLMAGGAAALIVMSQRRGKGGGDPHVVPGHHQRPDQ